MKLSNQLTSKIKVAKYNPESRTNEKNLSSLKKDIEKNGIITPLIIDKDNNLIDGHRRLQCAKELAIKDVPILISDHKLSKDEIYAAINSTQRKIGNADLVYIYVHGGFVPSNVLKKITELGEIAGKAFIKKISSLNISYSILNMAKRIAWYCKQDDKNEFIKQTLFWLVDKKQSYMVRRAIEDGISPASLTKSIQKNIELKRSFA